MVMVTTTETPQIEEPNRVMQAVELRKRRVPFEAIAKKLGFADDGVVRSVILTEMVKLLSVPTHHQQHVDIDLELELLSLDDMESKLWLVLDGADADMTMKGTERLLKIKTHRAALIARRRWE